MGVDPPKRALIVAYFFPPLGGGGVQRTLAFARHLPRYRWQPVVIAPRNPGYEIRDEALLGRLSPDLEVRRSFSPEPWWPMFRFLQRLRRRSGVAAPSSAADAAPPAPGGSDVRRSVRLAANVFFPDDHLTWLPFAAWSAIRAGRGRASAIISSSPPVTAHLAAGLAAGILHIPWIADFRDPWIGNPFSPTLVWPLRRLRARLERSIVMRASRVIAATPTLGRSLQRRYPEAAERIVTITNGYDGEEVRSVPRRRSEDGLFHLVYAGSVYGGVLGPFLRGVELFARDHEAEAARLRVEFLGWLDSESRLVAEAFASASPARALVAFVGQRRRTEAMAAVAGADAGLYLLANDPRNAQFVGGKLFEYIGLGVPVLAVAPPGDARWVLDSLGWGITVDPTPEDVARGLRDLVSRGQPHADADPTGRFDRMMLTGRLAELLDDVTASHAGPPPGLS